MYLAPIVLFTYNRLEHTRQTVDALQKNVYASESQLIIYSDEAKNDASKKGVEELRSYLKSIAGFKSVQIIERESNFGLARNIIDGVTQILSEYDKIIVLEDDLITSPYFLQYMNKALDLYQDQGEVACIHGYIYPIQQELPETFFIKGADCWGWGTWKRGWQLFESDGSKLLKQLQEKDLIGEFDFNGSYAYSQMLKDQIAGKNSSWAVRWYASAFLAGKLTLYPGKSYIQNIGMDNSGTHCSDTSNFNSDLIDTNIDISPISPVENQQLRVLFEQYFKSLSRSLSKRILNRVKSIFS